MKVLNIIFLDSQIPKNNFFPLEYNFVVVDIFLRKVSTFFSFYGWALCPSGYYLNGLLLHAGLPAGQCCHPQNHPNSYEHCYDEDIRHSFNRKSWSTCKQQGYYITGFNKSYCSNSYYSCIEKFKCCKMEKGALIHYPSLSNLKNHTPTM